MRSAFKACPVEIGREALEQVAGGFSLQGAADTAEKGGFAGLFGVELLHHEYFRMSRLRTGAIATVLGSVAGAVLGGLYHDPLKRK